MVRLLDFKLPVAGYILLVIVDMVITYIGVTHLGMIEGSITINYYGIELGVVLVFLLSVVLVILLRRLKNIRIFNKSTLLAAAPLLAIWMLFFIEMAAIINNLVLMG